VRRKSVVAASRIALRLRIRERRHEFVARVGRALAPETGFTEHVRVSMLLGRTTSPALPAATHEP
jgi:hypothetical protein